MKHFHRPKALSESEWAELAQLELIRLAWGLHTEEAALNLASQCYAARFDFVSGSPGYVGDLFVLQGDVLSGDPPIVLGRDEQGKLKLLG